MINTLQVPARVGICRWMTFSHPDDSGRSSFRKGTRNSAVILIIENSSWQRPANMNTLVGKMVTVGAVVDLQIEQIS